MDQFGGQGGKPELQERHRQHHEQMQQQGQQQPQPQSPSSPWARQPTQIPEILPHERVFPIQIGCELFKLSGASLSSDAPSYFSQYFLCQFKRAEAAGEDPPSVMRTLYIDRDPHTFRDIALHLQGYHVRPRDGTHFVRLFSDAQFYTLPRLTSQLYEESIFVSIGHREFQIPRDLWDKGGTRGNSPNYFVLGFAALFAGPQEVFPGLDREGLIRPPSILPPSVPHRSADVFEDLLRLLRGYPVSVRDEPHRQALLRDCRYFHFKGLEQRLLAHNISYNQARGREEIVLRLEDLLKSGISLGAKEGTGAAARFSGGGSGSSGGGGAASRPDGRDNTLENGPHDYGIIWQLHIHYARPYDVDKADRPYELVLEIGGESTRLVFPAGVVGGAPPPPSAPQAFRARAEFVRDDTRKRVARLLEVVALKIGITSPNPPQQQDPQSSSHYSSSPSPGNSSGSSNSLFLGGLLVRAEIGPEASIVLDGREWTPPLPSRRPLAGTAEGGGGGGGIAEPANDPAPKRRRLDGRLGNATEPDLSVSHMGRLSVQDDSGHAGGAAPGPGVSGRGGEVWMIKKGLWRLRVQLSIEAVGTAMAGGSPGMANMPVECVLEAVKLDAVTGEMARNAQRRFLDG